MTVALIYGFIKKMIEPDQFVQLATMIFMFYFTKKKEDE